MERLRGVERTRGPITSIYNGRGTSDQVCGFNVNLGMSAMERHLIQVMNSKHTMNYKQLRGYELSSIFGLNFVPDSAHNFLVIRDGANNIATVPKTCKIALPSSALFSFFEN